MCRARSGIDRPLYAAIRKYGEENFNVEVILVCDESNADSKEIEYIAHFESTSREKGYNLSSGGSSTFSHSEETKKKISESKKGYVPSPESFLKKNETLRSRKIEDISDREKESKKAFGSYWKGKKRPKRILSDAELEQRRNALDKAKRQKKIDICEMQKSQMDPHQTQT